MNDARPPCLRCCCAYVACLHTVTRACAPHIPLPRTTRYLPQLRSGVRLRDSLQYCPTSRRPGFFFHVPIVSARCDAMRWLCLCSGAHSLIIWLSLDAPAASAAFAMRCTIFIALITAIMVVLLSTHYLGTPAYGCHARAHRTRPPVAAERTLGERGRAAYLYAAPDHVVIRYSHFRVIARQ